MKWRMSRAAAGLVTAASVAAFAQTSAERYLFAQPPERKALVVGNAAYSRADRLPGSITDAERMAQVLAGLGFKVTPAKDVATRNEFLVDHFAPFVRSIQEGDIVVLYFSGHGFSHGADNYLLPLDFPDPGPTVDAFQSYVSSTALQIRIDEQKPSFQLMLLDSCREIKESKKLANPNDVFKGFVEALNLKENVVVGFAANLGARSTGSANGELSVYSKALVSHLPRPMNLDSVMKRVRADVKLSTKERQIPWLSESSSAEVYFRATPEISAQQREAWEAALATWTKTSVGNFLELYGSGPYGAAARLWMKENPDAPEGRGSVVVPQLAEAAWSIESLRSSPIYESAVVALRSSIFTDRTLPEVYSTADSRNARRVSQASTGAAVFASLGEAVTVMPIVAKAEPSLAAYTVKDIKPGKRLIIDAVEPDLESNLWLKARTDAKSRPFYLALTDPNKARGSTELGVPTKELTVSAPPQAIQAVVNADPVLAYLRELRVSGKEVSWVSIATPFATKSQDRAVQNLRIAYLTRKIESAGVNRSQVTATDDKAIESNKVRVRIFTR